MVFLDKEVLGYKHFQVFCKMFENVKHKYIVFSCRVLKLRLRLGVAGISYH